MFLLNRFVIATIEVVQARLYSRPLTEQDKQNSTANTAEAAWTGMPAGTWLQQVIKFYLIDTVY